MRKQVVYYRLLYVFSAIVFLVGCLKVDQRNPTPTPTLLQERDIGPTYVMPDYTPESYPQLKRDCYALKQGFPPGAEGAIILQGEIGSPSFLIAPSSGRKTAISQNSSVDNFYVSLNHQWFVYQKYSGSGNSALTSFIIADNEGKIEKTIPWRKGWRHLAGWLDNEHILISREAGPDEADSLIIFDPISQKYEEIPSKYPNMEMIAVTKGVSSWEEFRHTGTVYDPFLRSVVYPKYENKSFGLALWDMKEQKEISFVPGDSLFRPKWLADGSGFVINNTLKPDASMSDQTAHRELFFVSRDGSVQPLTHLNDMFPNVSIYGFKISPDGQKIALMLSVDQQETYPVTYPDKDEDWSDRVAILNIRTGSITDTCAPGYMLSSLAWSPDSRYLIFDDTYEHTQPPKGHVYLLDISNRLAYHVIDDVYPVGWLAKKAH